MNDMSGGVATENTSEDQHSCKADERRYPIVRCPVCDARAKVRSSEEISPETRRFYYACSNFLCGMTWRAFLSFEAVISPSGVSPTFRSAHVRVAKPPGRDFGQISLFDMISAPLIAP